MKQVFLFLISFTLFFQSPKAHSESVPVEIQDCLDWVAKKLPSQCPETKQPGWCDSIGITQPKGATISFLPYHAKAIKDTNCLAQKQIMFNVCVYGNYQKIPHFSNWRLFKPSDMRCGNCHKNYAKTGWCY